MVARVGKECTTAKLKKSFLAMRECIEWEEVANKERKMLRARIAQSVER